MFHFCTIVLVYTFVYSVIFSLYYFLNIIFSFFCSQYLSCGNAQMFTLRCWINKVLSYLKATSQKTSAANTFYSIVLK